MTLTIRQRAGDDWITVTLVPATLTRAVWSTMLHGQTGQEISDGWLDEGSTVHARPSDVSHSSHPYTTREELPDASDTVYDAAGMQHRIRHADWGALRFSDA